MFLRAAVSRRALAAAIVVSLLAGCGGSGGNPLKPNPAVVLEAEQNYVLLASGRFDELFRKFPAALQNDRLVSTLPQMQKVIPPGQASGPPTISGWLQQVSTSGNGVEVTLVYVYPDLPVFVTVEESFTGSDKDGWKLASFNLQGKQGVFAEGATPFGKGTITPPPMTPASDEP